MLIREFDTEGSGVNLVPVAEAYVGSFSNAAATPERVSSLPCTLPDLDSYARKDSSLTKASIVLMIWKKASYLSMRSSR